MIVELQLWLLCAYGSSLALGWSGIHSHGDKVPQHCRHMSFLYMQILASDIQLKPAHPESTQFSIVYKAISNYLSNLS